MTTRLIDSIVSARILPAALAAGALALGLPALAQADEAAAVTVQYAKSDLKTEAGARSVYSRIRVAARQVCGDADARELRRARAVNECRDAAVANAVASIGAPALASLHARQTGAARLASAGDTRTSR